MIQFTRKTHPLLAFQSPIESITKYYPMPQPKILVPLVNTSVPWVVKHKNPCTFSEYLSALSGLFNGFSKLVKPWHHSIYKKHTLYWPLNLRLKASQSAIQRPA